MIKKRLREQARNKCRNLSEEDKNKEREYRINRYHNMSEEKKQRLKHYQKDYRETKKLKLKIQDFSFYRIKPETKSSVFCRKWHH